MINCCHPSLIIHCSELDFPQFTMVISAGNVLTPTDGRLNFQNTLILRWKMWAILFPVLE